METINKENVETKIEVKTETKVETKIEAKTETNFMYPEQEEEEKFMKTYNLSKNANRVDKKVQLEYRRRRKILKRIQKHQIKLLNKLQEELKERLKNNEFEREWRPGSKLHLTKLRAYKNRVPDGLENDSIQVDNVNNALLLPVGNELIPIHIACVKNVTIHKENDVSVLRVNMQTPGMNNGDLVFPTISVFGKHPIYLKELTYKSPRHEFCEDFMKHSKELQKKFKLKMQLLQTKQKTEKIKMHLQIRSLRDIEMRPCLSGRKSRGTLTAFENGFRFVSMNQEIFEFLLTDIKHAIFKPCGNRGATIIHFQLDSPRVINAKLETHVQFVIELGFTSEDLSDPYRDNEIESENEEEQEEEARERYNELFKNFLIGIQNRLKTNIVFESVDTSREFRARHERSDTSFLPTETLLVAIEDYPYFITPLSDIEIVSLERTDNPIKFFDLVLIYKNYSRGPQPLYNVAKTNMFMVKEWLDRNNILFMEGGLVNVDWKELLKEIISNPEQFVYQDGGWVTRSSIRSPQIQ